MHLENRFLHLENTAPRKQVLAPRKWALAPRKQVLTSRYTFIERQPPHQVKHCLGGVVRGVGVSADVAQVELPVRSDGLEHLIEVSSWFGV